MFQATSAQLLSPLGMAADGKGNVYVVDGASQRVLKVSADGTITRVAGTYRKFGFSGDGGPATSALLNAPMGLALDRKGNLFIADWRNNRVRKVSSGGKITTYAGNGKYGYAGDGGRANKAQLEGPGAVAVDDAGNVYIAGGCCRVRKVSPGGVITTIAGTKTYGMSGDGGPASRAQLKGPRGVAVDGLGNVYIVDGGNHRVRKVRP